MNPTGDPAERGPLSGLVVADFSRILAGPYATMMLADLGADVIKVESPAGDDTRTWKPPTRDDQSTYYLAINRNKRSIALDLTDPDDLAVAQRLAARADVMVQNFRHGGLARFGLDHDTVRAANPGLVYASITGFGSGEGAALPGYDLMVQAISGLMSLTGDADGPPMRAGVAVCDVITGLHAAVGIPAALQRRQPLPHRQHDLLHVPAGVRRGQQPPHHAQPIILQLPHLVVQVLQRLDTDAPGRLPGGRVVAPQQPVVPGRLERSARTSVCP